MHVDVASAAATRTGAQMTAIQFELVDRRGSGGVFYHCRRFSHFIPCPCGRYLSGKLHVSLSFARSHQGDLGVGSKAVLSTVRSMAKG